MDCVFVREISSFGPRTLIKMFKWTNQIAETEENQNTDEVRTKKDYLDG